MKVRKTPIPQYALVRRYLPADHNDTFSLEVSRDYRATPDDILICFFTRMPRWVASLFSLRNRLVRLVGLKSSDRSDPEQLTASIRNSGSYGFVSVTDKSSDETVLLLSDKHLDARISLHIEDKLDHKVVSAITLVHYHNTLGRVYFFLIAPMHAVVVRNMLKNAVAGAESADSL